MADQDPGYNSERGASKDHSAKVWFQLAMWFQRRRLKCKLWMDDRRVGQMTDDRRVGQMTDAK